MKERTHAKDISVNKSVYKKCIQFMSHYSEREREREKGEVHSPAVHKHLPLKGSNE